MKKIFFVIAMLLAGAAHADTALTSKDFAFGIPMTPQETGASMYEAELPTEVYRGTVRSDLGDLRIFNKAGESVPFVIDRRAPVQTENYQSANLTVFPLSEDVKQTADKLSLIIKNEDSNTAVNLTSPEAAAKKRIVAYLMDATNAANPIRSMTLSLSVEPGLVADVQLEASDDLKSWRTILDHGVLAYLVQNGQVLTRNILEFPPTKATYYRLTLLNPERDLGTPEINAQMDAGAAEPERQWLQVAGTLEGKTVHFDLGGAFPIDECEFLLSEPNHVLNAQVESSAAEKGRRVSQFDGPIYRLTQGKSEVTTGLHEVSPGSTASQMRHWFLTPTNDETGLQNLSLKLKAGWIPEKIIFVAQGEGPYLLAYGNATARAVDFGVDALLENRNQVKPAKVSLGKEIELGGPSKRILPPVPPPSPWKKILTISLMGLGTLVLGVMAFRLLRQMGDAPSEG